MKSHAWKAKKKCLGIRFGRRVAALGILVISVRFGVFEGRVERQAPPGKSRAQYRRKAPLPYRFG